MIQIKGSQKSPQLLDNDRLILEALRCTGGATRYELVVRCDLPQTTVYDALARLERKGFVERFTEPRTLPGRLKNLLPAHCVRDTLNFATTNRGTFYLQNEITSS